MLTVIRGAGDLASGIALRLWRSHIQVVMTDMERPTAIRRTVCFSQAVVHGETAVEGVTARRAENAAQALELLCDGVIPVLADPEGGCIRDLRPYGRTRDPGQAEPGDQDHRRPGGCGRGPRLYGGSGLPRRGGDHAGPLSGPCAL